MLDQSELKWTKDLIRLFPAFLRALRSTLAWFAVAVGQVVLTPLIPLKYRLWFGVLQILLQIIVSVPITLAVIREVWLEENGQDSSRSTVATPLVFARLVILKVCYLFFELPLLVVASAPILLTTGASSQYSAAILQMVKVNGVLSIPALWWLLKSSLGSVFITLEKSSVISSVVNSHRLLNGRFWLAVGYLLPAFIFIILPCTVANYWIAGWFDSMLMHSGAKIWLLILGGISLLLVTGLSWLACMATILTLEVTLYANLKRGVGK